MECEQGRKVKEIFRVPTLPQGQNMCMSCRHANTNEFNILLACLWEAAGASNKSLGNPHCGEIGQQGSKNKWKRMLVLGYRKMLNEQGLTHWLKHLVPVAVQGCGLLSPERTQPSSGGGTGWDVQGGHSPPARSAWLCPPAPYVESCRLLYPHLLSRHVCPPSVWSDDCKLRKDTFSEAAFNVTFPNTRECQGPCLTQCC